MVRGLGVKLAVTPDGSEEAVRPTVPLNPLNEFTVIVELPVVPGSIVMLDCEAEMPKSGGGALVTVIL
jgi:hypothetical protein